MKKYRLKAQETFLTTQGQISFVKWRSVVYGCKELHGPFGKLVRCYVLVPSQISWWTMDFKIGPSRAWCLDMLDSDDVMKYQFWLVSSSGQCLWVNHVKDQRRTTIRSHGLIQKDCWIYFQDEARQHPFCTGIPDYSGIPIPQNDWRKSMYW